MAKTAVVCAVDMSCGNRAAVERGINICTQWATAMMVHAPHDELGLVLAGVPQTLNPLHDGTSGDRYSHLSVEVEVSPVTVAFLKKLRTLHQELRIKRMGGGQSSPPPCDVLETLTLCSHLLQNRVGTKKYRRVVCLITDAKDPVKTPNELRTVLKTFQDERVQLIVVGVDFTLDSACLGDNCTHEQPKVRNECVLQRMCSELGESSMVTTPEQLLSDLASPQPRKILQRHLLKVPLCIGEVRIATQLFTKALEETLPTLKRTTVSNDELGTDVSYIRVEGKGSGQSVPTSAVTKAYCFGRSRIPSNEAVENAMKCRGPRSLETLAFVPIAEVPAYILMGGVKLLLPLAGDRAGQIGFSAFVRAMKETQHAMIVRFVRTWDAPPVVCVCVPSCTPQRDALFLAPLPFDDDVRKYTFDEYRDITFTNEEEQLMSGLVDDMTVGKDVLKPEETFNPVLQQYYATVRAKLARLVEEEEEEEGVSSGEHTVGNEQGTDPAEEKNGVPPLLRALQKTSTAFTTPGNALEPTLQAAAERLGTCATTFPYVEEGKEGSFNAAAGAELLSYEWDLWDSLDERTSWPSTVAARGWQMEGEE